MTTQQRAKKGGEIGKNGEHYAGGTFLPNTTLTKMSKSRAIGNRRPRRILDQVFGLCAIDSVYAPKFAKVTASDEAIAYYGFTRQQVQDIVDRFNAGER
jgi:hypothetical protein